MLGAAGDVGLDVGVVELARQDRAGLLGKPLTLVATLIDHRLDLGKPAGMQRLEGAILELPLERVDTEPMGQRGVDLERLLGRLHLLLLAQGGDRAHVVRAIGELDQHHPQILGHRHDHLAVVLDLGLLAAGEADPGELGDAVDQQRDIGPEQLAHVIQLRLCVLNHVVQERG